MPSINYNSVTYDAITGAINFLSDTFHAILVTSAYTPDKDAHTKRSDITNEVVGVGYSAGGAVVTATPAIDNTGDFVKVTFSNPSWPASTLVARGLVICKWRGGAASADELVSYIDFGSNITSTADTFTATLSNPLKFNNP